MDNWHLIKTVKKGLKEKKLPPYASGILSIVYLNNKKKENRITCMVSKMQAEKEKNN